MKYFALMLVVIVGLIVLQAEGISIQDKESMAKRCGIYGEYNLCRRLFGKIQQHQQDSTNKIPTSDDEIASFVLK